MTNLALIRSIEKEVYADNNKYEQWSKKYFSFHQRRYLSDLDIIDKVNIDGKVLEVGSAPFHFTRLLMKKGFDVTGIDHDPNRLSDFIEEHNLKIIGCNIESEKIPLEGNSFGAIIFNEVFEHLRINPVFTLNELYRVLSKDGVLIMSTPNLYSFGHILRFLSGRGINNAYAEFNKLNTIGHMGHIRIYSKYELNQLLTKCGFKIKKSYYRYYGTAKGKVKLLIPIFKLISFFRPYQIHVCKK